VSNPLDSDSGSGIIPLHSSNTLQALLLLLLLLLLTAGGS
jgi:hypothetical protein